MKECKCGCQRPLPAGSEWHAAQCRDRYRENGGPRPMFVCAKCGKGICGPKASERTVCRRCEAEVSLDLRPLVALASQAVLGEADAYPVETTNPCAIVAVETESLRGWDARPTPTGLMSIRCPRCGGAAWEEPVVTVIVQGETVRQEIPVRCRWCNPAKRAVGVRQKRAPKTGGGAPPKIDSAGGPGGLSGVPGPPPGVPHYVNNSGAFTAGKSEAV